MLSKCFLCGCLILIMSCSNNKNPYENSLGIQPSLAAQIDTAHYTEIKWKDSVIDFSTIKTRDSVHFQYEFYNTGKTPLFILEARHDCGCIIAEFSKDPIMPGKSGFITGTFKSGAGSGEVRKTITVVS